MGLPMEPGGDEFALATAYEGKGRKRAIGFLLHNNIVNKTLVDVSIDPTYKFEKLRLLSQVLNSISLCFPRKNITPLILLQLRNKA